METIQTPIIVFFAVGMRSPTTTAPAHSIKSVPKHVRYIRNTSLKIDGCWQQAFLPCGFQLSFKGRNICLQLHLSFQDNKKVPSYYTRNLTRTAPNAYGFQCLSTQNLKDWTKTLSNINFQINASTSSRSDC
eukprot:1868-Amphidinium_carterae.1